MTECLAPEVGVPAAPPDGGGGEGDATAANQATEIARLNTLITHVDGVEALIGTTNTTLAAIGLLVDGLEASTDGVEALIAATNAALATVDGHVDGIEGLLTTIDGRVDGLEALIGTTNTTLTTIDGRVDTLEALIAATNAAIAALTQAGASTRSIPIAVSGIPTAGGTLVTGDVLCNVITFTNAARVNGGGGVLVGAKIIDKESKLITGVQELHIFKATLSAGGPNVQYILTDAEADTEVGWFKFEIADWIGNANNALNQQQGKGIIYDCGAGTSLFGILVTRQATVTDYATATNITVVLEVVRD